MHGNINGFKYTECDDDEEETMSLELLTFNAALSPGTNATT